MDPASMTVDELIAASAELDDRAGGLLDRLARITATASDGHGVTVEVNLDGMLIGLDLTRESLRLGAPALAEVIFRLTQRAAGAALAEGINTLEPVAGPDLMALLTPPEPEVTAAGDEDISRVETWAV